MTKMKAIVKQNANGNDFALAEVMVPEISENEVLVRVKAIGVGIHDAYFLPPNIDYPYVSGTEAAGVIEKVGENVSDLEVGDRVAFVNIMQPKGGTWAEYTVVSSGSLIVPIPEEMSFTEAAAIPIAGNTALKILHATELQSGDSLFIAGAAGAIGTFLIQMAKEKGALVSGSASEKNHEYMRSLGADKAVDYHDSDWTDQIKEWIPGGVDVAVGIHPGTPAECMEVVKDGGKLITVSGDQLIPERGIAVKQVFNNVDVRDELVAFMEKIASGHAKLFIEKTYPFEEALEALEKVSTRHNRGKLIITLL